MKRWLAASNPARCCSMTDATATDRNLDPGEGGVIRRTKRFSIRLQWEHLSVSWDPSALDPKVRLLYI
jgi:hypothetical protein